MREFAAARYRLLAYVGNVGPFKLWTDDPAEFEGWVFEIEHKAPVWITTKAGAHESGACYREQVWAPAVTSFVTERTQKGSKGEVQRG